MEKAIITDFLEDILEFNKINKNFTIYTKNNYIFEKYKLNSELKCVHLESLVSDEEFNRYTEKSYDFIESISNITGYIDFIETYEINIFKRTMLNSFFSLIHHYMLLNKIINNTDNIDFYTYSTNHPDEKNGLSMEFERFDNIFSYLSKHIFYEKITNINKIKLIDREQKKFLFKSFYQKILNILYTDFVSFIGKIKIKLAKKNFNSKIFIYGNNDIFPYLISNFKFSNLKKLNFSLIKQNQKKIFLNDYMVKEINSYFRDIFKINSKYDKDFISLFLKRFNTLINNYITNKESINNYLDKYIKENKLNGKIFTNGFFREIEKFFYFKLKENNVLVISIEHGITYGLSYFSNKYKPYYSLIYSDIRLLRSELVKNLQKIDINSRDYYIGSPPYFQNNFFNGYLNKFLCKLALGLNPYLKYISLSIPADINNYIYGPYRLNDFQNLEITKLAVTYLLKSYPNHKIIIKRYEFNRYIDDDFLEILYKYEKRVIIRKMPDLKFFLKACEINYTTVYTSTLEAMKNSSSNNNYISSDQNKLIENFENLGNKKLINGKTLNIIPLDNLDFQNNWNLEKVIDFI